MNKLQMCQRLRQEAGITGTGPASVTGQTGEMLRVVSWIDSAYESIQNDHDNWKFMRREFSFQTIPTIANYLPAAVGLTEHARWYTEQPMKLYQTSVADEQELTYWSDWDCFRRAMQIGANQLTTTRPTDVAIKPHDESLQLWAIPNGIYTVTGDYYIRPHVMVENTDEPIFPRQFHMLVVWRALLFYAPYDAAPERYAQAKEEYPILLNKLEKDYLPPLGVAGSMV